MKPCLVLSLLNIHGKFINNLLKNNYHPIPKSNKWLEFEIMLSNYKIE